MTREVFTQVIFPALNGSSSFLAALAVLLLAGVVAYRSTNGYTRIYARPNNLIFVIISILGAYALLKHTAFNLYILLGEPPNAALFLRPSRIFLFSYIIVLCGGTVAQIWPRRRTGHVDRGKDGDSAA